MTACVEYRAARNADVNDAANNLLLLLESRGYRIAPCAAATAMSPEERQEARRLADDVYRDAVMDAAVIDAPERAEFQQRYHLNPAETAEAERYDAALANGMKPADLTAEALRLFGRGQLVGWNRRFDLLERRAAGRSAGECERRRLYPRPGVAALRPRCWRGIQYSIPPGWIGAREGRGGRRQRLGVLARPSRVGLPPCVGASGICRFDAEPAYPVRWLGDALRKFGLALEAAPGDRKERGYILSRRPYSVRTRWRFTRQAWRSCSAFGGPAGKDGEYLRAACARPCPSPDAARAGVTLYPLHERPMPTGAVRCADCAHAVIRPIPIRSPAGVCVRRAGLAGLPWRRCGVSDGRPSILTSVDRQPGPTRRPGTRRFYPPFGSQKRKISPDIGFIKGLKTAFNCSSINWLWSTNADHTV